MNTRSTVVNVAHNEQTYVEIPPRFDAWMMGDRYGFAGPVYLAHHNGHSEEFRRVHLTRSGRVIAVPAAELRDGGLA